MLTTTRPEVPAAPARRIPWATLTEEREVSDQVWSALPVEGELHPDQVLAFLEREGLKAAVKGEELVYAYADGPRKSGAAVEVEWYLEFHFERNNLTLLAVEEHLVGP